MLLINNRVVHSHLGCCLPYHKFTFVLGLMNTNTGNLTKFTPAALFYCNHSNYAAIAAHFSLIEIYRPLVEETW